MEAREFVLRISIVFDQHEWDSNINGRQKITRKFISFTYEVGGFDLGDGIYGDAPWIENLLPNRLFWGSEDGVWHEGVVHFFHFARNILKTKISFLLFLFGLYSRQFEQ